MSKKSERLKLIVSLHARQEQDALQALGRSQQKLLDLQSQLQQLQKYREDYRVNFDKQQRAGMNVNQLLEFRAFADKLDKAIDGQQLAVSNQEQELLRARQAWDECHQRTKSLQKICDLALNEELALEFKREQLEQDARAARIKKDGMGSA